MSLRPRYSLLTLLVLFLFTATITVGVMRWHAPQHVVEFHSPNVEEEYWFTRQGGGKRVIQGPWVRRQLVNQKLVSFAVLFYRQGEPVDWVYRSEASEFARYHMPQVVCPLSAEELREFHHVRDIEKQRLHAAGGSSQHELEGIHISIIGGGLRMRPLQPNTRPAN
jgi:hypothetical protein